MTDTIRANQTIPLGGSLSNGQYRFAFQTDGNLVIYNGQNQAIWSPNIAKRGAVRAVLQSDGNFVVYNGANQALFNTGTQGHPGARFTMQSDGNAVIYDAANHAIWDSRTAGGHYRPPSGRGVFGNIASTFSSIATGIASVSKDVVNSPVWKVAAGAAAFIPGIGIPLSAGMVGAAAIGKATSLKDGIMSAAKTGLSVSASAGFDVASGIALGAKGMTGDALEKVRGMLPAGDARAGFDAALTLHAGRTGGGQAPTNMPPNAKAAFYASKGLVKVQAPPAMKQAVVSQLTRTPGSAAGVHAAVTDMSPDETLLQWVIREVKGVFAHV
jgi:hypothetical protein